MDEKCSWPQISSWRVRSSLLCLDSCGNYNNLPIVPGSLNQLTYVAGHELKSFKLADCNHSSDSITDLLVHTARSSLLPSAPLWFLVTFLSSKLNDYPGDKIGLKIFLLHESTIVKWDLVEVKCGPVWVCNCCSVHQPPSFSLGSVAQGSWLLSAGAVGLSDWQYALDMCILWTCVSGSGRLFTPP